MNASTDKRFALFYEVRGKQDCLTLYAESRAAAEQTFISHASEAARRSDKPYTPPVILDCWEITGSPNWSSALNARLGHSE